MSAQPERCQGLQIEVTASSADERRLACSAAGDALQLLGRCGISLRRDPACEICTRFGISAWAIFGLFDIKQDGFCHAGSEYPRWSTAPVCQASAADFTGACRSRGSSWSNAPNSSGRASHSAYEYPAYALQIESLAPNVREQFLQSFEQDAIRADAIFNDSILMFDPFFFAAQAYLHFKAASDGCAHLNALLDGEVSFILTMPLR